jgi:glycine/D-amino acid oxidase-like deaminating enzyme
MGPLLSKEAGGGDGCFIATGHGCWGILMGPGTGESMATLIATGKSTEHVDLQPYDPRRFQMMRVLEK